MEPLMLVPLTEPSRPQPCGYVVMMLQYACGNSKQIVDVTPRSK